MNGALKSNSVRPSKKLSTASRLPAQMAAFDQRRTTETRVDFTGSRAHVFDRGNFVSDQNFGFVQDWA